MQRFQIVLSSLYSLVLPGGVEATGGIVVMTFVPYIATSILNCTVPGARVLPPVHMALTAEISLSHSVAKMSRRQHKLLSTLLCVCENVAI
jgi:hypothetical protein